MAKFYAKEVKVYDEIVYVDTNTGEGFGRVLKRIDPLLCKMSSKTYMPGYSFEDIKQELAAIAIEGIRSYDPDKNVKLSTFLHIHLRNKLVSKLRSVNKISNDASSLIDENVEPNSFRRSREEILFSSMKPKVDKNSEEFGHFEDYISEDSQLNADGYSDVGTADFKDCLKKLSSSIDSDTAKIIELICLGDYSIKDAAEKVGLTGWAASMRLKKLSKNRIIKDILNKK
tara:strand:+ start:1350 stop:2036 length:687 start_codon:yes stop_codon:yes gene_type:complete